jgi:hypothetical protein
MTRLSRDTWLTLGILAVLGVVTAFGAVSQAQSQELPPLTSHSTTPDGARALWLWLEELDYVVYNVTFENYRLPGEVDLIFILEPNSSISSTDWQILDSWVEDGGILILSGERSETLLAAQHYEFELSFFNREATTLTVQTPLFDSPPVTGPTTGRSLAYWRTERTDFVTHLAAGSRPVVVSFAQGEGRVFLSATPYPFSNAGLKEAGNAETVLNMVSHISRGQDIWFDEWHHGIRSNSAAVNGPGEWLRFTPVGQSILYVVGVIFLAIVLGGRHFGRPAPLLNETSRRTPLEYITAIANLNRRARHRQTTMLQYRQWLKRDLGRRYRLDPTLADEVYVKQLGGYRPDLDQEALLSLLNRLSKRNLSEEEMVTAAVEVSEWLK